MEYYSSLKRTEILIHSKRMKTEDIMLSEVGQPQKDRDCLFVIRDWERKEIRSYIISWTQLHYFLDTED